MAKENTLNVRTSPQRHVRVLTSQKTLLKDDLIVNLLEDYRTDALELIRNCLSIDVR